MTSRRDTERIFEFISLISNWFSASLFEPKTKWFSWLYRAACVNTSFVLQPISQNLASSPKSWKQPSDAGTKANIAWPGENRGEKANILMPVSKWDRSLHQKESVVLLHQRAYLLYTGTLEIRTCFNKHYCDCTNVIVPGYKVCLRGSVRKQRLIRQGWAEPDNDTGHAQFMRLRCTMARRESGAHLRKSDEEVLRLPLLSYAETVWDIGKVIVDAVCFAPHIAGPALPASIHCYGLINWLPGPGSLCMKLPGPTLNKNLRFFQ